MYIKIDDNIMMRLIHFCTECGLNPKIVVNQAIEMHIDDECNCQQSCIFCYPPDDVVLSGFADELIPEKPINKCIFCNPHEGISWDINSVDPETFKKQSEMMT